MYRLLFLLSALQLARSEECTNAINCLEEKLVRTIDELDQTENITIIKDLVALRRSAGIEAQGSTEGIVERSAAFLANHELVFNLPSSSADSVGESRRRKLKRYIVPLLLLLKFKTIVVIPILLTVIGLLAFKGLGTSLISLVVAGAVGLKNLVDGHHHHHPSRLTYEIVPQLAAPWSRNSEDWDGSAYYAVS